MLAIWAPAFAVDRGRIATAFSVIPAKAGIPLFPSPSSSWIPAFAGMTKERTGSRSPSALAAETDQARKPRLLPMDAGGAAGTFNGQSGFDLWLPPVFTGGSGGGSSNTGNGGAGGGTHLATLAFQNFAGVKFKHVPFEGGGPSITAALGKHVNAIMVSAPEGVPQAQAGQLRVLGILGDSRLPKFPDVQTAKEQGMDFKVTMWRGVIVPKDTPAPMIAQIHDIFKKCMEDPDFKKKAEELSVELKYMNQADFGKFLLAEDERYKNLMIKEKFGNRYK